MTDTESGFIARPDYRVDVLRRRNEITARLDGTVLAQSSNALLVDEQDHGIVFYFPRSDVAVELTEVAGVTSRCPYKGDATYFSFAGDGGEPAAWSYDQPYEQVSAISGHIAFYQNRVEVSVGVATPAVVGYESGK